jgi:predicted nucleic acid-binding Zn ribbon protein
MRYFIPIDRATIRRNPDAGQTETIVPGVPTVTLLVAFFHPDRRIGRDIYEGLVTLIAFFDGEVVSSDVHHEGDACKYEISSVMLPTKDVDWTRISNSLNAIIVSAGGYVIDLCSTVQCPVHRHQHAPIPIYSYDRVAVEVECDECGERFPHEDLIADESDDGEDYCTTICPRCGAWGCCELEHEQLTEEIAEAALRAAAEGEAHEDQGAVPR